MKIILDGPNCDFVWKKFNNKEEWEKDMYSRAGYQREYNAHNYGQGARVYRGEILRYRNEPSQFPCVMIEGGLIQNPYGPTEIENLFFYDLEDDND